VRGFVCGIRHNGLNFGKLRNDMVIYIVKRHTVVHITRRYNRFQNKAVCITSSVRFIGELPFVFTFDE
jgi:hypothetical protein